MGTVQVWLNKADEEKLADTYFAAFPIDYMMIADRTLTSGKIRDRSRGVVPGICPPDEADRDTAQRRSVRVLRV